MVKSQRTLMTKNVISLGENFDNYSLMPKFASSYFVAFSRHDDSDDEKSDKNETKDSSKDDEEEGTFFYHDFL